MRFQINSSSIPFGTSQFSSSSRSNWTGIWTGDSKINSNGFSRHRKFGHNLYIFKKSCKFIKKLKVVSWVKWQHLPVLKKHLLPPLITYWVMNVCNYAWIHLSQTLPIGKNLMFCWVSNQLSHKSWDCPLRWHSPSMNKVEEL